LYPIAIRGKVPIEPLLSTQWFVKIRPLANRALEFLDEQYVTVFCSSFSYVLPDRDTSRVNEPIDGANDGGSGVGVLLEIARVVRETSSEHRN
jgi:hypothetical protein